MIACLFGRKSKVLSTIVKFVGVILNYIVLKLINSLREINTRGDFVRIYRMKESGKVLNFWEFYHPMNTIKKFIALQMLKTECGFWNFSFVVLRCSTQSLHNVQNYVENLPFREIPVF